MNEANSSGSLRRIVADPAHGPLPALMLVLTVLTGVVDAVSILSLGRVFVANMTGNVVFVGFALAGARGFSLPASLSALAGFLVGAAVLGAAGERVGTHRGRLLAGTAAGELLFVVGALLTSILAGTHPASGARDAIAALLALAMGLQNAAVRQLKVFDLTTTVLTMTLTGIAADVHQGHRGSTRPAPEPAPVPPWMSPIGRRQPSAAVGDTLPESFRRTTREST